MVQAMSRLLPDNAIVLSDAGTHAAWLAYYLELSRGQNFRKPGSFGSMASGVNGAIGVKCAHPDRTVVAGCGDGAYLLAGFELMSAVQNNIPVIWIIFTNGEFQLTGYTSSRRSSNPASSISTTRITRLMPAPAAPTACASRRWPNSSRRSRRRWRRAGRR